MKAGKQVTILLLAAILLATNALPVFAAASEVALTIRNKTQATVNLILRGPDDFDLTITRVTTIVKVDPGTYEYRYRACGLMRTGTIVVTNAGGTLTLRKCEKDLNGIIVITNLTGKTFTLVLNGPRLYALTIKPGENKLTLVAGRYQFSAKTCGETVSGVRGIKSGNKNTDWVFECD